jgi:hypothetical protein
MATLKNRQLQIPGGFKFSLPPLNWTAGAFTSFDTIVNQVDRLIAANPGIAGQYGWPTKRVDIENWVDGYNAQLCAFNGWTNYVHDGTELVSVPKTPTPHRQTLLQNLKSAAATSKELMRGARSLLDWLQSGEPPVDRDLAIARATICVACPHNNKNPMTEWFTVPASELIRKQIAEAVSRDMTTPLDEKLNICDVCYCPLPLKVQTPVKWIKEHISPETLGKLAAVPGCWVANEIK